MMKSNFYSDHEAARIQAELNRSFAQMFGSALACVQLWRQRRKQRFELGFLTTRQLNDIGMTDHQRQVESSKPFWRA